MPLQTITNLLKLPNAIVVGILDCPDGHHHFVVSLSDNSELVYRAASQYQRRIIRQEGDIRVWSGGLADNLAKARKVRMANSEARKARLANSEKAKGPAKEWPAEL